VQKEYACNNDKMAEYVVEVRYVPRLDNHDVDHLTWIASSKAPTLPDIIIERLSKPSVKPAEPNNEAIRQDLMVINEPEHESTYNWMQSIKMFLENQPPSDDNAMMIDVMLFRRGATTHEAGCNPNMSLDRVHICMSCNKIRNLLYL
jgi:hypothetical protein